jgi:hypothetical protein
MNVLYRLAVPEELAVLLSTMYRTSSMNEGTRADFSRSTNQVGHNAEDLVGEVAVAEDVTLAEAGCEDGDDDRRLL